MVGESVSLAYKGDSDRDGNMTFYCWLTCRRSGWWHDLLLLLRPPFICRCDLLFLLRPPILLWPPYADTTYYCWLGNAGQGWWCGVDDKSLICPYIWVHLWWFSVLKFLFCTNSWCKSLIFRYIDWGSMQGH